MGNDRIIFNTITVDNGLPAMQTAHILQDKYGFIWVSTFEGLCRYDGTKFRVFQSQPNELNSLSNSKINYFKADKKGNLWITTNFGLNKYNIKKEEFIRYVYEENDSTTILSNRTRDFIIDINGNIWIPHSNQGITVLYPEKDDIDYITVAGDKLPSIEDYRLFDDKTGSVWIIVGSRQGRVIRVDYQDIHKLHFFPPDEQQGILSGQIDFILVSKDKTIWAANDNGVQKLNPENKSSGKTTHFSLKIEKETDIELAIEDTNGHIWFGTSKTGIRVLDTQSGQVRIFSTNNGTIIPSDEIRDILCDMNGDVWFISGEALCWYQTDKDTVIQYKHNQNDPYSLLPAPTTLYQDRAGVIWLTSDNFGLAHFDLQKSKFSPVYFRQSEYQEQLSGGNFSIIKDDFNNIWIGTYNGIFRYNDNRFERIKAEFVSDRENIWSIYPLRKNDFLIGGGRLYLFNYNEKSNSLIKINDYPLHENREGSIAGWVHTPIFQDSKGFLWMGTTGGVSRTTPENIDKPGGFFTNFKFKPGDTNTLSHNRVWAIEEDQAGNIWFGTINGLSCYNPEKNMFRNYFRDINDPRSLSGNNIKCITCDSKDRLWIGSEGGGLSRYHKKSDDFTNYTTHDGLPSNTIYSILVDQENTFWMSTKNGISHFNPDSLTFENFKMSDGLHDMNFNMLGHYKDENTGDMYFLGNTGFTCFNPKGITKSSYQPEIYITEFSVRNKKIGVGDKRHKEVILSESILTTDSLHLSYKDDVLYFEFAAMHYSSPQDIQYAYMLEGFENEWNYRKAGKNFAHYTNLKGGDYLLRIRATNCDGVWSKREEKLFISVVPPFWQTWWFRISLIVFIVGASLAFFYWRVNALKARQKELEQKVAERTMELREANTELEEKQEEVLQQNEELNSKNDEINLQKEEIQASRDQLEKAFRNIKVLSEFGQKLTATFDFDTINAMIYDYVSSLMDAAAFGIGIYNNKRKVIDFPYFMEKGKPVPYFYKELSNNQSLTVKCFLNKEDIIINDLSEEYKHYLEKLAEVKTSNIPHSMIHLPLIVENKAVGTLTVNSYKKNAYTETDVTNLRTLASYISIALDNARAYRLVNRQKEQITGSIRYGQTIQQAMLPPKEIFDKHFENFVIYRPKDIVSGDFYWFAEVRKQKTEDGSLKPAGFTSDFGLPASDFVFLAVVDCTGHGVPGAFMSMIGNRLLIDIINERKIFSPAKILDELNMMVRKALRQDNTDNQDGMDVCLCRFEKNNQSDYNLTYAGAKRPLIYYNSVAQKIQVIEGTRKSIGGITSVRNTTNFEDFSMKIQKGDIFYLSTDGFVDQCNPQKKKFSQARLIQEIIKNVDKPLSEQGQILEKKLTGFQQEYQQRDDITFIGIRL